MYRRSPIAEPSAGRQAAADLVRAIDAAERRARNAYGQVEMTRLLS